MKRLLTATFLLALIGMSFNSCKKDNASPSNYFTIEGTFTIGDKTYTNPTFDLGEPQNFLGYFRTYTKTIEPNGFDFYPINNIDLGDNVSVNFDNEVYSISVGPADMFIELHFYLNNVRSFDLYSSAASVRVTKVEEIGGYFEGTYEGTLVQSLGKSPITYNIKGRFKVIHTDVPTK